MNSRGEGMTWRELIDDEVERASKGCRRKCADHFVSVWTSSASLEEQAAMLRAFLHQNVAEEYTEAPLSVFGRVLKMCDCGTLEILELLGGCPSMRVEADMERGLARVAVDWDGLGKWSALNEGSSRRGALRA